MTNKRFTLTVNEINALGLKQGNADSRYRLTAEQQDLLFEFRGLRDDVPFGIQDACNNVGVSPKDVKMLWLKTKGESVRIENPYYQEREEKEKEDILERFLERFEEKINKLNFESPTPSGVHNDDGFDRLVYTDTHIAMNPNPTGYSLYGGVWNEKEVMERLDIMLSFVVRNQRNSTLLIDDLGDFFDGFDGKTVRREHDLPQNMDNQTAFDVGFQFKVKMIDILSRFYSKIICHNVCESNHSSSFDYIVNSAFKVYAEKVYGVEVMNFRKFIDHYQFANRIFILCHGKDSTNLKFGFKPFLDPVQREKINDYIDTHFLLQKDVKIEFSKGDSHQYIFDSSSSDRFDYFNYPAFSPSSSWVQTNFKKGKSGFVFFNYNETRVINDYLFEWKS